MKNTIAENHHEHSQCASALHDHEHGGDPPPPKPKKPKYRSHLNAARHPAELVALATKRVRGRITHPGKRGRA